MRATRWRAGPGEQAGASACWAAREGERARATGLGKECGRGLAEALAWARAGLGRGKGNGPSSGVLAGFWAGLRVWAGFLFYFFFFSISNQTSLNSNANLNSNHTQLKVCTSMNATQSFKLSQILIT